MRCKTPLRSSAGNRGYAERRSRGQAEMSWARGRARRHIPAIPFELTDEEAAVLARELTDITWGARYQLSPRVKVLSSMLAKLRSRSRADQQPRRCRGFMRRRARADIVGGDSSAVRAIIRRGRRPSVCCVLARRSSRSVQPHFGCCRLGASCRR